MGVSLIDHGHHQADGNAHGSIVDGLPLDGFGKANHHNLGSHLPGDLGMRNRDTTSAAGRTFLLSFEKCVTEFAERRTGIQAQLGDGPDGSLLGRLRGPDVDMDVPRGHHGLKHKNLLIIPRT